MRITKGKSSATVVLGQKSVWTRLGTVDHRVLDKERKDVRESAKTFCERHGLSRYEIYACKAHGGFMLDQVDLKGE